MPNAWVDRIFARMLVRYGSEWIRRWEGVPEEAVKADWAEQLDGMERSPARIKYALDNLPDRPPTVTEFRAACNRFHADELQKLPAPVPDRETVERFRAATADIGKHKADPFAWARNLREIEQSGHGRLTLAQRDMWRAVLNEDGTNRAPVFA